LSSPSHIPADFVEPAEGELPTLNLELGQISQQGQRELNEDTCACVTPSLENTLLTKGACAMISDGTGGDGTGRDASHYIENRLFEEYYNTPDSWTVERSIMEVLNNINRWLFGRRSPAASYLCTLSALVMRGRSYHVFHVGDTRIYLWRGGELTRLTTDHHYPGHENRLVRAMGLDSGVRADMKQGDLEQGDIFVMTTDGVHGCLQDEDIVQIMEQGLSAQGTAVKLSSLGIEKGHGDNATVQVVSVKELPLPHRSEMIDEDRYLKAAPELNRGDQLDGYRIIERMTSGGMATIYKAEEIESGKEVAIKCPKPELMKRPVQLERFHREEWTGLRLHSPYLMRMFPPQPKRSQYYYIVMEICRGTSLRRSLELNGRFKIETVRNMAYQLCKGLHFMHNLNMIHRDIKPENIIVSDEEAIKIVDYGIVRLPGLSQLNTDEEVRSLIGSPYYMAPEFFNDRSRGSVQTDIYALGVVLYEMISGGEFPYGKAEEINYQGEAPEYRSLRRNREDVPPWLDQVIRKCVEWNPSNRYEALSELLYSLDHPGEITVVQERAPLIVRRPLTFWKWLCFVEAFVIFFLGYMVVSLL
jgi:serine/threonine protein kinase/serine/threonine protein phosphatase PrpC